MKLALVVLSALALVVLSTPSFAGSSVAGPSESELADARPAGVEVRAQPPQGRVMRKLDRFVARFGVQAQSAQARRIESWRLAELARIERERVAAQRYVAAAAPR